MTWPDRQAPLSEQCPLLFLKWVLEPPVPKQALGCGVAAATKTPPASISLVPLPQQLPTLSARHDVNMSGSTASEDGLLTSDLKGAGSLQNGYKAPHVSPRDQATPKAAFSTAAMQGDWPLSS